MSCGEEGEECGDAVENLTDRGDFGTELASRRVPEWVSPFASLSCSIVQDVHTTYDMRHATSTGLRYDEKG